jgi:hypothetical protein
LHVGVRRHPTTVGPEQQRVGSPDRLDDPIGRGGERDDSTLEGHGQRHAGQALLVELEQRVVQLSLSALDRPIAPTDQARRVVRRLMQRWGQRMLDRRPEHRRTETKPAHWTPFACD